MSTLTIAYQHSDGTVERAGTYADTKGGREMAELNAGLYEGLHPGLTATVEPAASKSQARRHAAMEEPA